MLSSVLGINTSREPFNVRPFHEEIRELRLESRCLYDPATGTNNSKETTCTSRPPNRFECRVPSISNIVLIVTP